MVLKKILLISLSLVLTAMMMVSIGVVLLNRSLASGNAQLRLERACSEFLHRRLTIETIETGKLPEFGLTAHHVQLWDEEGTAMVDCPLVVLKFSPFSIWKLTVGIEEVRFVDPIIKLRSSKRGQLTIQEMISDISRAKAASHRQLFSILFNRFVIENGQLDVVGHENEEPFFKLPLTVNGEGRLKLSTRGIRFPFVLETTLDIKDMGKNTLRLVGTLGGDFTPLEVHTHSATTDIAIEGKISKVPPAMDFLIRSPRSDVREIAMLIKALAWMTNPANSQDKTPETGKQTAENQPSEIRADVRLDSATFSGARIEKAAFQLHYASSTTRLEKILVHAWGGSITGEGTIKMPEMTLKVQAENIQADQLFGLFNSSANITGLCQGNGDLAFVMGPSFLNSAHGDVTVKMTDGHLPADPMILKVLSVMNVLSLIDYLKGKKQKQGIPVDQAGGQIKIENGKAVAKEPFLIENELLQLGFIGTLDFVNKQVDGNVVAHVLTVPDEIIGTIPGVRHILLGKNRSFFPIWVQVKGPFHDPSVRSRPLKSLAAPIWETIGRVLRLPKELLDKR